MIFSIFFDTPFCASGFSIEYRKLWHRAERVKNYWPVEIRKFLEIPVKYKNWFVWYVGYLSGPYGKLAKAIAVIMIEAIKFNI